MSMRSVIALLAAGVAALGAVLLAGGLDAARHRAGTASAAAPGPRGGLLGLPLARQGASGSHRVRRSALEVERGFVSSYARFLDDELPLAGLRYASITARAQARAGGRLARGARDGPLRLRSLVQDGATAYSAQATATLADRQVSLPLTITLIDERDGWWVSALEPPDLDVDRPVSHTAWPPMPAPERRAARRFARAYLTRLGGGPAPALGATARRQLALGEAPLGGIRLPSHGTAATLRLRYGPLEGDEFAATASVTVARRRLSFTFLMLHTRDGWECGAFL